MYRWNDYLSRGALFVNNRARPKSKRLATLMIYATDLCDSACRHCLIWAKRPVVHLPKKNILELMTSRCVTRNTTVGLEGGEFLLHPEALEILEWFHTHHPRFDLLSNCLKPELLIDAVKRYPPQRLYVSLDGTKETYASMRGKDGYLRVLGVIEALAETVPISVMFTLSPYNDFDDLEHVGQVCHDRGVDLRVGIYNEMPLFDTLDAAHGTGIGSLKGEAPLTMKEAVTRRDGNRPDRAPAEETEPVAPRVPDIVGRFRENRDFLMLYDRWRAGTLKLRCHSILDSLVVLPDGSVPVCQNRTEVLGNIHQASLDTILASQEARELQQHFSRNCNACWINFHRKYDVVLYRSLESILPKNLVERALGTYQWGENERETYRSAVRLSSNR